MSMLKPTEINGEHWSFMIFFITAIALCCLMLASSWFLGGRSQAKDKNKPFESGLNSFGTARLRLFAKFYLVSMIFVTVDVESLYLFVWSVSVRETGWLGFTEATLFVFIILVSLIYLVRVGVLNLAPVRLNYSCHRHIFGNSTSNH